MRPIFAVAAALFVPWGSVLLACGGETASGSGSAGGGSSGTPDASSSTSSSSGTSGTSSGESPACCPHDPQLSGCMNLGGSASQGCAKACDFFCSENWRIEKDATGCEVWRYDVRKPAPGENAQCVAVDAGTSACNPPCKAAELCEWSRTVGGVAPPPAPDGGTCPPGTHDEGGFCLQDWSYACVARPNGCSGAVTCSCDGALCTQKAALCRGASNGDLQCEQQAP